MQGHRLQNITPYNNFSQISKKLHTQHQQTITNKNKNKNEQNKQSKTTNQSQYNSFRSTVN